MKCLKNSGLQGDLSKVIKSSHYPLLPDSERADVFSPGERLERLKKILNDKKVNPVPPEKKDEKKNGTTTPRRQLNSKRPLPLSATEDIKSLPFSITQKPPKGNSAFNKRLFKVQQRSAMEIGGGFSPHSAHSDPGVGLNSRLLRLNKPLRVIPQAKQFSDVRPPSPPK